MEDSDTSLQEYAKSQQDRGVKTNLTKGHVLTQIVNGTTYFKEEIKCGKGIFGGNTFEQSETYTKDPATGKWTLESHVSVEVGPGALRTLLTGCTITVDHKQSGVGDPVEKWNDPVPAPAK